MTNDGKGMNRRNESTSSRDTPLSVPILISSVCAGLRGLVSPALLMEINTIFWARGDQYMVGDHT